MLLASELFKYLRISKYMIGFRVTLEPNSHCRVEYNLWLGDMNCRAPVGSLPLIVTINCDLPNLAEMVICEIHSILKLQININKTPSKAAEIIPQQPLPALATAATQRAVATTSEAETGKKHADLFLLFLINYWYLAWILQTVICETTEGLYGKEIRHGWDKSTPWIFMNFKLLIRKHSSLIDR